MRISVHSLVVGTLLALLAGCASTGGGGADRVVYHLSEGLPQASNGLRNINNHLEVNPAAKIVVVTHALGVDFLMKDAKDRNGNKYEDLVEQVRNRGVQLRCLRDHAAQPQAHEGPVHRRRAYVPSGVAEITRLQQKEGYAYLKP
jgi:intracellular sulfur oxidation DsrE/DsrF family protein